jgi:tetratricopeptide (TPR) repeat protein
MTTCSFRLRNVCLFAMCISPLAVGAALILPSLKRPTPRLDGLQPLLASRQFDEVERRITEYLRLRPENPQANLLMAQVCLARDPQKPRLALDHLARIQAGHRALMAMVLLNQGKAYSALGRNDRAEVAWNGALRLEPRTPEVGWDLLGLYYVQGRRDDAHRLGIELHTVEPDPRDRAQLMLELLRQDAQPIGPDSLIRTLEPLVRDHPEDLQTAIALGLALIRNSRFEEGLSILRDRVKRTGSNPDAWNALLFGLEEAGKLSELTEELAHLPSEIASKPRFERYRGSIAQHRQDWPLAAEIYLRAWQADPSDFRILYRLSRALRAADRLREAETFDLRVRGAQEAKDQILPLYEEANAVKTLGVAPHRDLYHRLADLRERMGRFDEALAWHRMVLRDQPDDLVSRTAIERHKAIAGAGTVARP